MAETPVRTLKFKGTVPKLTADGNRKPYRAFVVEVTLEDGSTHEVSHLRFSQFNEMDNIFADLFPLAHKALPPFPRKTIGRPTEEQWKERCRALEIYFTAVLAMPALAQNSTFAKLFKLQEPEAPEGSMLAAIYTEWGTPDKIVKIVNNLPKPAMPLKAHDVFIEVHASSVNPVDVRLMEGASDVLEFIGVVAFPVTPGVDVSGIVRGVGSEVTAFSVGDAVFADTGIITSSACAQFVVVPDSKCARKPKSLSFVEAAAYPHAGLVAYQTLVHDLKVDVDVDGRKKKILIVGGHTGSGSIAIQLGRYLGCNVSCHVAAGAEQWATELGADSVTSECWWTHFKGQNFDAVFDTIGEEEGFERSKEVLGEKGSFATELPEYLRSDSSQLSNWVKQGVVTAGRKIKSVYSHGYHNAWASPNSEDLDKLRACIDGGAFKSVVTKRYPLAKSAEAFSQLNKDTKGKIVIIVKEGDEAELRNNDNNNNNNNNNNNRGNGAGTPSRPPPPSVAPAIDSSVHVTVRDLGADLDEDEEEGKRLQNPFG